MRSRWPEASTFLSGLTALRDSHSQTPHRVLEILRGNRHWQGLLCWLLEMSQASAENNSQKPDENWLMNARKRQDIRDAVSGLPNRNEIDRYLGVMIRAAKAVAGITSQPESDERLAAWRHECERSFTDELSPKPLENVTPLVKVPVALAYRRQHEGTPGVAWLELETLSGDGDTVPHPGDVWATIRSDEGGTPSATSASTFSGAMSLAFRAARDLSGLTQPVRGRWRIVDQKGLPVPLVGGESPGGAALHGWHRAMTATVVDPRVLVMAAVREPTAPGAPWHLAEVGEIEHKVKAILDAKIDIDTIATVGRCVSAAKAALRRRDAIRVIELKSEVVAPVDRS